MKNLGASTESAADQVYGRNGLVTHDVYQEIGVHPGNIAGLIGYTPRVVGALSPNQRIALPEELVPGVEAQLEYFERIGMPHPLKRENIVTVQMAVTDQISESMVATREQLLPHLEDVDTIYTFVDSPVTENMAKQLSLGVRGTLESSENWNHKSHSMERLKELGVRVPDGGSGYNPEQVEREVVRLYNSGYQKVVVKGNRSASGTAMWKLENQKELDAMLQDPKFHAYLNEDYFMDAERGLGMRIEGWAGSHIDKPGTVVMSPGAVVHVGDSSDDHIFLGASQQILSSDDEHEGNVYPLDPRYWTPEVQAEVMNAVEKATEAASKDGVRGFMGIDFVVVQSGNNGSAALETYAIEINRRFTGQTHGLMIAHDMLGSSQPEDASWLVGNLKVPQGISLEDTERTFGELDADRVINLNHAPASLAPKVHGMIMDGSRDRVLRVMKQLESNTVFTDAETSNNVAATHETEPASLASNS